MYDSLRVEVWTHSQHPFAFGDLAQGRRSSWPIQSSQQGTGPQAIEEGRSLLQSTSPKAWLDTMTKWYALTLHNAIIFGEGGLQQEELYSE